MLSRESSIQWKQWTGSFVFRDNRADWPDVRMMTSTGLPAFDVPGNSEAREPKGHEVGGKKSLWSMQLTSTDCLHHTFRSR